MQLIIHHMDYLLKVCSYITFNLKPKIFNFDIYPSFLSKFRLQKRTQVHFQAHNKQIHDLNHAH